jgi:hypothetical protein
MSSKLYDGYVEAYRVYAKNKEQLGIECKRIVNCILAFFKEEDEKQNSKDYWKRRYPSTGYLGAGFYKFKRNGTLYDFTDFESYDGNFFATTCEIYESGDYDTYCAQFPSVFLDMTDEEITAHLDAEFAEKRAKEREEMAEQARKKREAKEKKTLALQEKEKALLKELAQKYPDVI